MIKLENEIYVLFKKYSLSNNRLERSYLKDKLYILSLRLKLMMGV